MARVLLIHGSCSGAWCWRDVLPYMDADTMDLPSHGTDKTPLAEVTLDMYVNAVIYQVNKSSEQVVLAGHSAAGIVIAAVAERIPKQIKRLVYICAYAPNDGDALDTMRKRAKRQLVMPAVVVATDRQSYGFDPIKMIPIVYHDCPLEAISYAQKNICPEAILPHATKVHLGTNYNSVPRSYILCGDDRTIPPEEQERMISGWPLRDVHRLNCGHAPFFSCPEILANLLSQISESST